MTSSALKNLTAALDSSDSIVKGMSIQKDGGDPNGDLQKGEGADDDEGGDEDDDEDYDASPESLEKGFVEEADLLKAFGSAAPALGALTKAIDEQFGEQADLLKGMSESIAALDEGRDLMADALAKSLNLTTGLAEQVNELTGTVQAIAKALNMPAARRGVRSAAEANVIQKALQGTGAPAPAEDRKATEDALIKAVEAGKVDGMWLHRYIDRGQPLPDDVKKALS